MPPDIFPDLIVDPSYTAKDHSDHSALAVGYNAFRESDGLGELTILDAQSDRYRGIQLAETIVETAERNKVGRYQD